MHQENDMQVGHSSAGSDSGNNVAMLSSQPDAGNQTVLHDLALIFADYGRHRSNLIPLLQAIQQSQSYLSPQVMKMVAEHLIFPPARCTAWPPFTTSFASTRRAGIKSGFAGDSLSRGGRRHYSGELRAPASDSGWRNHTRWRIQCGAGGLCGLLCPGSGGHVDDTAHGHMAPSKVEGLLLGFELEKERQEREQRNSESND